MRVIIGEIQKIEFIEDNILKVILMKNLLEKEVELIVP